MRQTGGPELKEEGIELGAEPVDWGGGRDTAWWGVKPRLDCPAETETEWQ